MRVVYLAAGAGGMYCGSCLRDNRVAATLIAQGRDVRLIPLYTPIRTDERDVSQRRVFYGGINVYLQQKSAFFRRLPNWLGRLLDARRLLRRSARLEGSLDEHELGALTVSVLSGERGFQRRELDKLVDALRNMGLDLVHLPNLMFVGLAKPLKAALRVPVLCTLAGEDLFLDQLPAAYERQASNLIRERVGDVDAFVAVTDYYAASATKRFDLPADRVHVVRLGIRADEVTRPARPPAEPFTIGYLARICPEKGLADLCEAFKSLRSMDKPCRLRAAGCLRSTNRGYLDGVYARLREHGLEDSFEYAGELDRAGKWEFLRSLHVLSVPTVYPEAKGLYVLEAMAAGVPVVQPNRGSFPEIVGATGGGLLYDPTGADALARAIGRLMDDPALRNRLALQGRSAVHESFTAEIMAEQTWAVYRRCRERQEPANGDPSPCRGTRTTAPGGGLPDEIPDLKSP